MQKDNHAFYYMCSKYQPTKVQRIILAKIEKIYQEFFGLKITYKKWMPHKICAACSKILHCWKHKENDPNEYRDQLELHENDDNYIPGRGKDKVFQVTLQEKLNNLVRDLGLPKANAELLTSFMEKRTT